MPVNDRYPLPSVLAECRRYFELRHRKVFVEYVLLAGVNDSRERAGQLADLDPKVFKVNLIPYNPTGMYDGSSREAIAAFKRVLDEARIPSTVDLPAAARSPPPAASWRRRVRRVCEWRSLLRMRCRSSARTQGAAVSIEIRARLRTQSWGASSAAWRHSRHFARPSLVAPLFEVLLQAEERQDERRQHGRGPDDHCREPCDAAVDREPVGKRSVMISEASVAISATPPSTAEPDPAAGRRGTAGAARRRLWKTTTATTNPVHVEVHVVEDGGRDDQPDRVRHQRDDRADDQADHGATLLRRASLLVYILALRQPGSRPSVAVSDDAVARPWRTSAQVVQPNATAVATARTTFQRTHRPSSNCSRTAARSRIRSGSPAALMSSLSGTLISIVITMTAR